MGDGEVPERLRFACPRLGGAHPRSQIVSNGLKPQSYATRNIKAT